MAVCVAVLVVLQVTLCAPPVKDSRRYRVLGCPIKPVLRCRDIGPAGVARAWSGCGAGIDDTDVQGQDKGNRLLLISAPHHVSASDSSVLIDHHPRRGRARRRATATAHGTAQARTCAAFPLSV